MSLWLLELEPSSLGDRGSPITVLLTVKTELSAPVRSHVQRPAHPGDRLGAGGPLVGELVALEGVVVSLGAGQVVDVQVMVDGVLLLTTSMLLWIDESEREPSPTATPLSIPSVEMV